jgi:GT2 family glycosyltransferase
MGTSKEEDSTITCQLESPSLRQIFTHDHYTKGMVYAVVLNWNGWRDTVECLTSLLTLDYKDHNLLVVDNGSSDESVSCIRSRFPGVELLEAGSNLGFAGGCNIGIRHALARGAEYIWLINNDTKADPHALTEMVETAQSDPKIGVVGSVLYDMEEPQRIQYWGGGRVNLWLGRSWVFTGRIENHRLQYLSGASMLLRRDALEEVGLLDERFFMYWEDSDICLRMREAGWKLAVAPKSKIWHKQCASTGRKTSQLDLFMKASMVRFLRRHAPVPAFAIFNGLVLMLGNRLIQGDWVRVRALVKDILQDYKNR